MLERAILNRKIDIAAHATDVLIKFLSDVRLENWASSFRDVLECLAKADTKGALSLQKSFRFGGPGSLTDVMIEREDEFHCLLGSQSAAMSSLRLYIEYGIDRSWFAEDKP